MTLRERIGRLFQTRSQTSIGSGYVAAAPVLSGTYVTPQTAIGLTSVFAAINVISRDVATLPVNVYRKIPGGGREVAEEHPVQELLKWEPNDETDAFRLRRDWMGHVLGWGNGYLEVVRNKRDGTPEALQILHPAKTVAKRSDTGRLYYELDNDPLKRLLPENCLHAAGLGFNGLTGYSPLTVARQSIGLGMAAEQFGAAFFGNGAIAHGILKTAKKVGAQAVSNLRNSINQIHQGSQSAHQFMVLEEGMDWINTQVNPEDAQFLATRQFTAVEIARLYSLPPHKIGDYSQSHLANVEEANLDYIITTLAGWLVMLEGQFNLRLLTRKDRRQYVILHDMSALMRGNMSARIGYYQGMRNMGCFSANDILMAEGRNPLPKGQGGEKHLVQMQYQPLENAGKQPPPAKERTLRHNPNHGADGKFSSGAGGGLGGHGSSGNDLIAHSNDLGERLADHNDPVSQIAAETGVKPTPEWESSARDSHKELLASQASDRKELAGDQSADQKQFQRDQKQEAKDFDRDQAKDAKEFQRGQKQDAKDFDRDQKKEHPDEDVDADEFARGQADEKAGFQQGQDDDKTEFHAEQGRERDAFTAEQAEAKTDFAAGQADELASFLSDQRDARKELVSDLVIDLVESHDESTP